MGPAELVDREFGYIVGRAVGSVGRSGGSWLPQASPKLPKAFKSLPKPRQRLPKASQILPKVSPDLLRLAQRPPEPNSSKISKIVISSPSENWPKVKFEADSI